MPEGDTVHRSCAALHTALAGRTLTRAELRVPAYATVRLAGATVLEVVARGKHQLTRLDNGLTLHTHLKMEGTWRITGSGQRSPGPAHQIRVILGNPAQTAFGLRLGITELLESSREDEAVGHLGPDLLATEFDADEALRRLRAQADRTIGEALLDQRNLAGIGTFYRAEVLFLQGIHPRTPVAAVGDLPRLVARAGQLLRANLTRPYQVTTGNTRPGERAWVFERPGKPCRRCGTLVRTERFGPTGQERLSYWCPSCQPAAG
ncbi:DNA glycosylase [Enemella dayhoffiae]|uniref:DNA-(apurinic or apyrimidinic site) lyase n=1 Tax=Enemella dayhoffiae TaxID=2016507 RepID=A0A255HAC8_9ACTN|nr:DNA-formamidopyrimidine glycosylase family protein [Enemella dayhoffiae]OYO23963.1 DNA glycosylase [Enemella dayhoffiae]